jgi:hypothetical protein
MESYSWRHGVGPVGTTNGGFSWRFQLYSCYVGNLQCWYGKRWYREGEMLAVNPFCIALWGFICLLRACSYFWLAKRLPDGSALEFSEKTPDLQRDEFDIYIWAPLNNNDFFTILSNEASYFDGSFDLAAHGVASVSGVLVMKFYCAMLECRRSK